MILSLLVCLIFFVTVIALVGVSEIGSKVIGSQGTATWQANATTWNTIAAFGGVTIFLIVAIFFIACLLIGAAEAISMSSLGEY